MYTRIYGYEKNSWRPVIVTYLYNITVYPFETAHLYAGKQ